MQLYRFTNSLNRYHYGVVVEMVGNGAYVLSDAWQPTDKVKAPATYAYISFEPNPFVIAAVKHDLLPLDTPVAWQTPEIRQIVAMMQAGTFAEWWQANQSVIVRKFINGYKVDGNSKVINH
jgi:hypothetical protein